MGTPDINKLLTTSNTDKVGILNKLRSLFPDINEYSNNNTYRTGDIVYRIEGPELVVYVATEDNPDSTFNSSQWKDIRTIHMDLFKSSVLADMYMLNNDNAKPIPQGSNLSNYFDIPGTYYLEGPANTYLGIPLEKRDDATSNVKFVVEEVGGKGRENIVQRIIYDDGSVYFRSYNKKWSRSQAPYSTPNLDTDFTIYVSKDGNDSTADGTRDKPFKTIQEIINNLSRDLNGRTIVIRILGSGIDANTRPGELPLDGFTLDNFRNGTIRIINDLVNTNVSSIQNAVANARGMRVVGAIKISNCTANISFADLTLSGVTNYPVVAAYVPALIVEHSHNVDITRCIIDGAIYRNGTVITLPTIARLYYGIEARTSSINITNTLFQRIASVALNCIEGSNVVINGILFNDLEHAMVSTSSVIYATKISRTEVLVNSLVENGGHIYETV